MSINIAIDGPAGAGKSTVARRAAEKLGFIYVDTGAMYRAIALYLIRQGVAPEDKETIADRCAGADVAITYQNGEQVVSLNGENVNGLIRTDEVTRMSSAASAVPAVRARLLDLQRGLAARNNVLMDGRDIGTCILPDADVKIFLTAGTAVRAKRRFDEMIAKGDISETLESVEAKIIKRDEDDRNREISPLREAEDAVHLDTSDMTIDQAVEAVLSVCRQKGFI
ncbi:MAG TPA: (d)CMP kinase [Candidatus Eisenbergiella merdavium]|uniref:Cytidylate kinase n=1 Tax=Candidatus Eisenbergiella merdavium TaxID=2838551 RepID=A0A9D2NF27_9FIRM|nr:(d)CMP kinase [Candidatus Eisenbergiella merdavium]